MVRGVKFKQSESISFYRMSQNPAQTSTETQDFDIQHDDEFEDFKINYKPVTDRTGEYTGDWDDDVVEEFATILKNQREMLQ